MGTHISGEAGDKAVRRRKSGQLAVLTAQLGDNALAIIGVVTSIAGFAGLVTSGQVRKFVNTYPYPVCISLIIVLLALLVSLNYAQTVRRQRNRLQAVVHRTREPRPSTHDVGLFAAVLADLPLDGPVIAWLRGTRAATLSPDDIPADVLTALDRAAGWLSRHPVGFDDTAVARALAEFLAAIHDYRVIVEDWTVARHNAAKRGASRGGSGTGADPVAGALAAGHGRLLAAYDSLLVTAHERGLDIGH